MHDLPLTSASDGRDTHSSLYEKTTADERRKIDRAIVNRDPPTYRAVFEKYRLAEKGVSFTAFYNYARRLRAAAQNYNLAELVTPSQADLNQTLPRLLGDRLIETLLYHEDVTPAQIHRLTLAYASAITTAIKAHDACHLFPRRRVPSPCDRRSAVAEGEGQGGVSSCAPSQISNPEISNPAPPPPAAALVDAVPSVPVVLSVPSPPRETLTIDSSIPRGVQSPRRPFRLPNSPPIPLAPHIDLADLSDPDPRREALRQRIRDDLMPLFNYPDSS